MGGGSGSRAGVRAAGAAAVAVLAVAVALTLAQWLPRMLPLSSIFTTPSHHPSGDESAQSERSKSVVLRCYFEPLPLDSLGMDGTELRPAMRGLQQWRQPNKLNASLPSAAFRALLPPGAPSAGRVWDLVEAEREPWSASSMKLRAPPPEAGSAAAVLHRALSLFHWNVFLQTRFEPRGTVAVIRALNRQFLDIVFRCHAEFQLNSPPLFPFWFTPAQFLGRLIIARNGSKLLHFSMDVPTKRRLNVDMEWVNTLNENMEVDIGFIPLMSINMTEPVEEVSRIIWDDELSLNEAHQRLEERMFPFKEVSYLPLEEAIQQTKEQGKVLHCIVLWGALDDQSC